MTVRNGGPQAAPNVVLTNLLPPGATFLTATTTAGACTHENGLTTCALGSMSNAAVASVTVSIAPGQAGTLTNVFGITHQVFDPYLTNNLATLIHVPPPIPLLTIADTAVAEGSSRSPMVFTLTLSTTSTAPIRVFYATANGTALAGPDYDATGGNVVFPAGVRSRTITLSPGIRGNTVIDSNRFLLINLSNAANAQLVRTQAVGWIIDDDFHTLSVQPISVVEGNTGRTNATFNIRLAPPSAGSVTVDYAMLPGTATAGVDFVPRTGTLVFPPGATNLPLNLPVNGDLCNETNETFFLDLSSPGGAMLGTNDITGQILNDDAVQSLRILALMPEGNGWRIDFTTACDRSYRLLRSGTLLPGSWSAVSPAMPGTGGPASARDSAPPPASPGFYRIEVVN